MSDVLTAEQVDEEVNRALTALSALARSHEALREREQQYHNLWHDETDRAELAEQRADEAEKALADARTYVASLHGAETYEQLEGVAENGRSFKAALQRIVDLTSILSPPNSLLGEAQRIARDALEDAR